MKKSMYFFRDTKFLFYKIRRRCQTGRLCSISQFFSISCQIANQQTSRHFGFIPTNPERRVYIRGCQPVL